MVIAEARRNQAKVLDLGRCGLKSVPEEIGTLPWLESLSLADKRSEWDGKRWHQKTSEHLGDSNDGLTDLWALAELPALRMLYTNDTQARDLSPLSKLSSLECLDISNTPVNDLSPLASLSALRELYAYNTYVTDLGPLASLSALQSLRLKDTRVTDLMPLANLSALGVLSLTSTDVMDLTPLAGLPNLSSLALSRTRVEDLAPLSGLTGVVALFLSSTSVRDLGPLGRLSALKLLDISSTKVSDLKPLAGLAALEWLNASETAVNDLGPLTFLAALRTINVAGTEVARLSPLLEHIRRGIPVRWSSRQSQEDGIYVENCPLATPPADIVKQGNEAILNYFAERTGDEVDHLYEAKMLILGEGGAGKTSLLRRLYQPDEPLPSEADSTKGIAIYKHEYKLKNGRTFRLNVWDFGGQQIYHATHQFFLTHRSLYVLVDDTRKDHKSVSDEGFKYWLDLIDVFSDHSPTLIFQNEKGGRSKEIDFAGIAGHYQNVKERYTGNLESRNAADRFRDAVEHYASNLSHIGEELPARWIKVREEVEKLAENTPYVPVEKYFELYERHIEFDEKKALHLSRYLHDLGVFLHFQDDPLLARTVILQNTWATEAVFRILDDEVVKKKFGRFNRLDCTRLWKDSVYARMHPELLALMQRFELCYELRDSVPQTWLVPQLLPAARPLELTGTGKAEDLVLRYRYEFLPKGIISRLTVRQHRFVQNPAMAWVTGVLLEHDVTTLLVAVLANGTEIELRARGPEKKDLLSVISADLDALNESFQGLRNRVDKRVPCICKACSAATTPEFFDQRALLKRRQDSRLRVECPRSYEDVSVLELLDGVRLEKLPGWGHDERATVSKVTAQSLREIRVFLASSRELMPDRDAFELFVRQQNDRLLKKGFNLKVERFENLFAAMSATRKQDDYNKIAGECDVFVTLFSTTMGEYTEEEFDFAYRQFKARGRPFIYTFFKDAAISSAFASREDMRSLWAFQDKLRELEHYPTEYKNVEDLQLQFRKQLDKLLEESAWQIA
jgi:Leucine-rich repeat (LRR) protein